MQRFLSNTIRNRHIRFNAALLHDATGVATLVITRTSRKLDAAAPSRIIPHAPLTPSGVRNRPSYRSDTDSSIGKSRIRCRRRATTSGWSPATS
jgi:hypothetical protein